MIYNEAYNIGKNFLKRRKKYVNEAVMFDIDDTLFDYNQLPIKDIINLLNLAKKLKYVIIIITARSHQEYVHETIDLLKNINYDILYLRKEDDDLNTFKNDIKRELFFKNNIKIVLSVGDNWIDVNGSYSGEYIKLPNNNDFNLYSSLII